ncbi:hypothetical protein IJG72_01330 [bacterium]|nr:hypothetical protein [bacterium]
MSNLMNKLFEFSKKCLAKNDMFLYYTGAVATLLGTLSGVVGIYWDKNIDKKDRPFYVPREIVNGILQQIVLAVSTFGLIKGANSLMKSEKLGFKNQIKGTKEYETLANGIRVGVGTAAFILTNNVFGPFINNGVGAYFKKKAQEKKAQMENVKEPEKVLDVVSKDTSELPVVSNTLKPNENAKGNMPMLFNSSYSSNLPNIGTGMMKI